MSSPVRMVFISSLSLLTLLIFLLGYRYVYPKKKLSYFTILLLLSCLPVISLLRPGAYESGDFTIHVYRSMSFFKSLSEGYLLPSWSKELNAHYGYPLFIFLNPLAYYSNALFHVMGFSFISSMKMFLASVYILSGVAMYGWIKEWLRNSLAAFSAAIVYLFAPYHLVDLHFRATVGEMLIFCTLPFLLFCVTKLARKPILFYAILTGFAISLVLLSHQALAFFCGIFTAIYIGYLYNIESFRSKQFLSLLLLSTTLGVLSVSYVLIPHLIHTQYIIRVNYPMIFPKISELFYSPWRYGLLFQGPSGELSFLIGYTQLLVLFITLIILLRYKFHNKNKLLFWLCTTFLFIFMITSFSNKIWETVPLINITILSTRLLIFVVTCISILSAFLTIFFQKRPYIITVFLLLSVGYTVLNWGHRRVIPEIGDIQLYASLPQSTYFGEGWGAGVPKSQKNIHWEKDVPKDNLTLVTGTGTTQKVFEKSEEYQYISYSENGMQLRQNTWYFPGWKIRIDEIPYSFLRPEKTGLLTFSVPRGLHTITIYFEDIFIYRLSKIVCVVSFFGYFIYFGYVILIKRFFRIKIVRRTRI